MMYVYTQIHDTIDHMMSHDVYTQIHDTVDHMMSHDDISYIRKCMMSVQTLSRKFWS